MTLQRRLQVITPSGTESAAMEEGNAMIRVAFASTDMIRVDQHFGSARGMAIYRLTQERADLVEAAQFGEQAQDGGEDKLLAKFECLEGCAAVYCAAAGSSAVKQLLALGTQPVRVSHGTRISDLLRELQTCLKEHTPPPWMAKAVQRQQGDPSRFDAMASEPWEEEG
ncbi:nitrogen fixation protein NifX [Ectothiorhodospira haloalkaliphila]|uniref:Nitrogen fixation protein NifX n=1 Tax=Ectothiorhodospira haloalkaliphila TaxID=421628 RepID=W8L6N1_9GAMM|nr:NifB/NifX family molybdenum-iron cluster-binding protein [Ectothiorhodospira haloalkaliphila]AHK79525.1 nitrogen fixation protein NifX [Ectothiorhodospira haloalkaliphila]